jgi:hypothetical protein
MTACRLPFKRKVAHNGIKRRNNPTLARLAGREEHQTGGTSMNDAKKRLVALAVFLTGFLGPVQAQDKRPDQAAIVDSFKQKIQEVLNKENSDKGWDHATVVSSEAKPSAVHAKKKYLHKDGTPCSSIPWGCYLRWVDDSGTQYVNSAGKPCDPTEHPETCHVMGKPAVKNLVWFKGYTALVSDYGFDVRVTDSLVTPYTGILRYSQVSWFTAEHPTKEEAEKDNNFISSLSNSFTFTYGYQDGQWKLLK